MSLVMATCAVEFPDRVSHALLAVTCGSNCKLQSLIVFACDGCKA